MSDELRFQLEYGMMDDAWYILDTVFDKTIAKFFTEADAQKYIDTRNGEVEE
jgi:hypothetical protein